MRFYRLLLFAVLLHLGALCSGEENVQAGELVSSSDHDQINKLSAEKEKLITEKRQLLLKIREMGESMDDNRETEQELAKYLWKHIENIARDEMEWKEAQNATRLAEENVTKSNKTVNSLEKEIYSRKVNVKIFNGRIVKLDKERTKLNGQIEEKEMERESLTEKGNMAREGLDKLKVDIRNTSELFIKAYKALGTLGNKRREHEAEVERLKKLRSDLEHKLQSEKERLNAIYADMSSIKRELYQLKEMALPLTQNITDLNRTLDMRRMQLKVWENRLLHAKEETIDYLDALEKSREKLNTITSLLETQNSDKIKNSMRLGEMVVERTLGEKELTAKFAIMVELLSKIKELDVKILAESKKEEYDRKERKDKEKAK